MEGVRKRFVIQKHKNGDGMKLWNWLATSKKWGGGGNAKLKNNIGTNRDVNTKLGNDTGGLRDCKIGVFEMI